MTQSLSQIRELLTRYRRANGSGSIKVANSLLPDVIELLIDYVDEATGRKAAEASDVDSDLAFFAEKLHRCEARCGVGSTECDKIRSQLAALENAVIVSRMAAAPERKVFTVDVGRLPPEEAKKFLTEAADFKKVPALPTDMSVMTDDQQGAYIEAQFRQQGIVNNGARYMGPEELVEGYLALLNAPAQICAPCEVQPDGTSAIVDTLVQNQQIAALVADAQANAEVASVQAAAAPKKATAKRAPAKPRAKK